MEEIKPLVTKKHEFENRDQLSKLTLLEDSDYQDSDGKNKIDSSSI